MLKNDFLRKQLSAYIIFIVFGYASPFLFGQNDEIKAFEYLLTTDVFSGTNGFYDERPSKEYLAFRKIIEAENSIAYFNALLKNASSVGKLYAMIGLFRLDHETFKKNQSEFLYSDETIKTQFGCESGKEKIQVLFKSAKKNVLKLETPFQTWEEWINKWEKANKGGSFEVDIIHGGYTAIFFN